jgi:hypothetical protein
LLKKKNIWRASCRVVDRAADPRNAHDATMYASERLAP